MEQPIQPIVPEGTPLPTPPVGVPPFPITPFSVWTWNSPVIPNFYWNVYSAEQRIKSICKEIGKIEAYLQYLVTKTNENIIELHQRIDQLTERVAQLERHVEEEVARLDALIAQLRADLEQEIQDREDADDALGERIDQEILDRTHGDDQLHAEIAQEVRDRTHADDALHGEISTETQNRIHADDALGARIDSEAQARQAADASLHAEIAAEATARTHGDEALHTEISTETQARIHADSELESKLEAELQAEADIRQEGDTALRESISTETTERKAADATLGQRITQETSDREAGDFDLNTKIATEAYEREVADDELANELADETEAREQDRRNLTNQLHEEISAREAGDAELETKISKRLLPSDVQAGNEIEITKDPDSNTITISSTVAHSISALESLITSLQAALTSETEERRADDASLWTAVNARIERGKILAGAGIKVENDPDSSTVTISSTSTIEAGAGIRVEKEGETTTVALNVGTGLKIDQDALAINYSGSANITHDDYARYIRVPLETDGKPCDSFYAAAATSMPRLAKINSGVFVTSGDVIARHQALEFGVAPGQGLEIGDAEDGADDGRLRAKTATESEAGIISESRVKELAGEVAPSLSAKSPLKLEDGVLSAIPYPDVEGTGPVTVQARSAQLPGGDQTGMTFSVGVNPATEDEAGIISEARVKELIAEAIATALAQNPTE